MQDSKEFLHEDVNARCTKKILVKHKEISVKRQDFTEYSLLSSWLMIFLVWRYSVPKNKQQMVLIYTYGVLVLLKKNHDPNL